MFTAIIGNDAKDNTAVAFAGSKKQRSEQK